jgi:hypothetical protein
LAREPGNFVFSRSSVAILTRVNAMMTKDEARRAVEAELQSRRLTKPMTLDQLNVFCGEMYKRLHFESKSERLSDILKWAEDWQSKNLRST